MSNKTKENIVAESALATQETTEINLTEINLFESVKELFPTPKKGEINNSCLQVRTICNATGQFNLGGYKDVGKTIKFNLVGWKKAYGNFTGDADEWYQLFFIPSPTDKSALMKNTTFGVFIKSVGYRTFEPFVNDILGQGFNPRNVIIVASMSPKQNDLGRFHIVEWSFEDGFRNQEEFDLLSQELKDFYFLSTRFVNSDPLLYHDLPPTIQTWNPDLSLDEVFAIKAEVDEAIKSRKEKAK
jgi:hypothetical protein